MVHVCGETLLIPPLLPPDLKVMYGSFEDIGKSHVSLVGIPPLGCGLANALDIIKDKGMFFRRTHRNNQPKIFAVTNDHELIGLIYQHLADRVLFYERADASSIDCALRLTWALLAGLSHIER